MAIICSHCFIFCLQLAANRGSFKLPLQASFLLFALAVHHNPRLHKLDAAQSQDTSHGAKLQLRLWWER